MYKFVHPSTVMVAGPSQSGKTTLVVRMIREHWFDVHPTRIFWLYKNQNAVPRESLASQSVIFIQGLDASFERKYLHCEQGECEPTLIILDDLMSSLEKSESLESLFTEGSHHMNASIIYLVQNVFQRGARHRTVSLNTHYLILFKMPRDATQIEVLARQMFGARKKGQQFIAVYKDAVNAKPFGYLVVDCRPDTPDHLRLRSENANGDCVVYVLREDEPI